jgi:sortase A
MEDSPRRVTRALRVAEWVLLVIGLVSIGWYTSVRMAAAREQSSLSHELDRFARGGSMPARARAASRALVGRIEVPRLKLSAVAREGVDVKTLRVAVGHIPGTALPGERGNAGFAAHRDTFFGPLKSVRTGDEVIVTTPGGVFRYMVTGTRVVEPEDLSVLDPTAATTLTLVTCYPFDYLGSAPQRFIVRATLKP